MQSAPASLCPKQWHSRRRRETAIHPCAWCSTAASAVAVSCSSRITAAGKPQTSSRTRARRSCFTGRRSNVSCAWKDACTNSRAANRTCTFRRARARAVSAHGRRRRARRFRRDRFSKRNSRARRRASAREGFRARRSGEVSVLSQIVSSSGRENRFACTIASFSDGKETAGRAFDSRREHNFYVPP